MGNKTVNKRKQPEVRKFPEKVYVFYGEDSEDYLLCDEDLMTADDDTDIAVYSLVSIGRKKVTVEFIT